MISLERRASDNKQEEVILEEGIWTTYFPNSLVAGAASQVEDSNSSISILEDLVVILGRAPASEHGLARSGTGVPL